MPASASQSALSRPLVPACLRVGVGGHGFLIPLPLVCERHERVAARPLQGMPYCVVECLVGARRIAALDLRRRLGMQRLSWPCSGAEDAAAVVVREGRAQAALLVDAIEAEEQPHLMEIADTLDLLVPSFDPAIGRLAYLLNVSALLAEPSVASGLAIARIRLG